LATRTYGSGNDNVTGTSSADTFYMGFGDDRASMGGGNDRVYGQDGNDNLRGGVGNDRVAGDLGNDYVYGETGNDVLFGGEGTDRLYGGDGADNLSGNIGNDALYLGLNDGDRDVVNYYIDTTTASGQDTIYEFNPFGQDRLSLGGLVEWGDLDSNRDGYVNAWDDAVYTTGSGGSNLVLDLSWATSQYGDYQTVTFAGVRELTYDDFAFV
jgi:Ca2+-binding RTX toxin-like protein